MTAVAVTFDGTRLNSSDDNTDWGNFQPSTGGAPSSEGANAYQITTGAAANTGVVGRQSQSSTSRRGVDFNDPGTAVDYTAAANRLFYMKGYVTDAFDLNATFGAELAMGSADTSNYHSYNVAGSGAALSVYSQYPAQGGYLITCIDPTIDTWADTADSGGAFDQTAVSWYAFGAQMVEGNSKSENVAFDALDYGTGLTLLNGTGADAPGKYTDFVEEDQNLVTNRWGAAIGNGDNATLRGIMTVGSSGTATEFDDTTSIVTFPDGYHSRGLFGVNMNIENASSVLVDGALIIGQGTRNGVDANDTRPDYEVIGTAGAFTFSGQMRNFRDVTFTSVCDVNGEIECMLLVQNSANIENATIKCNSLTSVAVLQDPTFGASADLNNTTFVQNGAGHALELSTAGDYTFTNLFFVDGSGTWGANTTASSMIDVTASTGTVNILVSGGTAAITYITAGATVNIIAAVDVTVSNVSRGTPVAIIADETVGSVTKGDLLANEFADATGTIAYGHNDEGDLNVIVRARNQGVAVAAIAEDGGVFVDETEEASSNTTADMTLLPATQALNDAYYFGHDAQFRRLNLDISTARTGTYTVTWEYWNGAWVALSGVVDGTTSLTVSGKGTVSWTLPGDWATTTVTNQANTGAMFYVRLRVSAFTSSGTAAVGRKVQLDTPRYLPYAALRTISTGTGLADNATWQPDTISKFDPAD